MSTNKEALQLATKALREGRILSVKLYSGGGTATAGPNKTAVPSAWARYAIHFYRPGGRNDSREEFMADDAAHLLLDHCGRGNLGQAARKALEA